MMIVKSVDQLCLLKEKEEKRKKENKKNLNILNMNF